MRQAAIGVIVIGGLLLAGCSSAPPALPRDAEPVEVSGGEGAFRGTFQGKVTAAVVARGSVRHAGLGLPVVSPDGRFVAALEHAGGPGSVDADAPLTGRGLGGVSLWIRAVDPEEDRPAAPGRGGIGGAAVPVALENASFPAFGPDGRLWSVSSGPAGDALLSYDPASGSLRRLAAGLERMAFPAPGPDGRLVAVSGFGANPEAATLFLVDSAAGRADPGPPPGPGGQGQVLPVWEAPGVVLFVELREAADGTPAAAALRRWRVDERVAADVAALPVVGSVFDAGTLFAGVATPLCPGGRWLVFFDATAGPPGLRRVDLVTGAAEAVVAGGTAAASWDANRLVVAVQPAESAGRGLAKENGLRLVELSAGNRGSVTLLPGDWAPRWVGVDPAGGASVLAVTPGERPDRLKLVQLYVLP